MIVDIAIDQGGCSETSRPTTHSAPTYTVDDVVHYCVTNMPGAVARTSTFALNNVTLPFVLALADKGYRRALAEDVHLRHGLNVHEGRVTYRAVADALKLKFTPPEAWRCVCRFAAIVEKERTRGCSGDVTRALRPPPTSRVMRFLHTKT